MDYDLKWIQSSFTFRPNPDEIFGYDECLENFSRLLEDDENRYMPEKILVVKDGGYRAVSPSLQDCNNLMFTIQIK